MSPYNRELHPSEEALLRFFEAAHLPDRLRRVSEPFAVLAAHIINSAPPSAETTTALRKLLEAKDCAVRAAIEDRA
ncbi:MAG TPA: hypothetical protein VFR97_02290 [Capillimicrobium sp.]|nr:hypothetical protein [Capillimicrobium sp.]